MMVIKSGEIYGKQTAHQFVMYNVLKVKKSTVTLQNIDNPLRLFEITSHQLLKSGYIRISQTPYIETKAKSKHKKTLQKPTRCPYTMDFIELRADSERPGPILPDLFS